MCSGTTRAMLRKKKKALRVTLRARRKQASTAATHAHGAVCVGGRRVQNLSLALYGSLNKIRLTLFPCAAIRLACTQLTQQ